MKIQRLTILSYIASSVLWLLALLVLLFNLLGLWDLWHWVGFIYYAYMIFPLGLSLAAYQRSKSIEGTQRRKRYTRLNGIAWATSIVVTVLDLLVFSTWFGL